MATELTYNWGNPNWFNKSFTGLGDYGSKLQIGSDTQEAVTSALSSTAEQSDLSKYLKIQNALGITGQVMNGLGTLTGIGLGSWGAAKQAEQYDKQLAHAQEVFNTEKALQNKNLANQAKMINEQVAARANLAGLYAGQDKYATTKADYEKKNSVDDSSVA